MCCSSSADGPELVQCGVRACTDRCSGFRGRAASSGGSGGAAECLLTQQPLAGQACLTDRHVFELGAWNSWISPAARCRYSSALPLRAEFLLCSVEHSAAWRGSLFSEDVRISVSFLNQWRSAANTRQGEWRTMGRVHQGFCLCVLLQVQHDNKSLQQV